MLYRPIYKKYLLYATLLVTLFATAYYRYQDSLEGHLSYIVEASIFSNKVVKNANKDEKNLADVKKEPLAKVDIFEVYKKPTPEPVVKEVIKPSIASKAIPAITYTPPPSTPTVPPVPFKYIGKILGDDEYQVFVGFNGKYLAVKEGDIIQQTYKIEKITPPVMTLTYIPMNILQNMQIGEPN
jgi:hypothetical protein